MTRVVVAFVAVSLAVFGTPVRAQDDGGGGHSGGCKGGGGGGGHEEGLGNNLSVPLVFAEGHGLTGLPSAIDCGLRPRPDDTNPRLPYFDANNFVVLEGARYSPQGSTSTWQAAWVNGAPEGEAAAVKWGDNLLARSWGPRSQIRVETTLFQEDAAPLTAYAMTSLFGSQSSEVWGTDGSTYASTYRAVFTLTPRLIIERITGPGGTVVPGLQRYEGSIAGSLETEGPGRFGSEVNGAGTVIYGFNWQLGQWHMPLEDKLGWWRLTFTLDPIARYTIAGEEGETPQAFEVPRNVRIVALSLGDLGEESAYTPVLVDPYTTVLEVQIKEGAGGGGGGGGHDGGGGGGGETPPLDPDDGDGDGLPDAWEAQFGIDPTVKNATADSDRDGLTNEEEYEAGSHPRGVSTRYFAEGVTGGFFRTHLSLFNSSDSGTATTLLRFMTAAGTTINHLMTLPPSAHQRLDVGSLPGLEAAAFMTIVEADTAVAVERTTTWDDTGYGSHVSEGAPTPGTTWYLAEGATHSGFQLFYLIGNPGTTDAEVEIRYLLAAPHAPIVRTYTVPASSRRDIWVNLEDIGLAGADVAAAIVSTAPIVVERSMYLDTGHALFGAGTGSTASPASATTWYFAEGAIGDYFDTYLLLLNPGPTDAVVQTTYLLPEGSPLVETHVVAAGSRVSLWVDTVSHLPADTTFSTVVASVNGVPIVAERAMWWPGSAAASWLDGHTAAGVTTPGTRWAFGGPGEAHGGDHYVLIQNTSAYAGQARITVAVEGGGSANLTVPLPALSRQTVPVDELRFPGVAGRSFGILVESEGAMPARIVVERSGYKTSGGAHWAAGSNVTATRLQ